MVDVRAQRRSEVRNEVRAAAIGLMSSRGFDGVTVEEIAALTSVSASTIYRHFGTKEALVLTPGRPLQAIDRFRRDTKRDDRQALRRAVNRVYGKDPSVRPELDLMVGNPGLLDQFRREWLAAIPTLATAIAERSGTADADAGLTVQAAAAATAAAACVGIEHWVTTGIEKLGPQLDIALAVLL